MSTDLLYDRKALAGLLRLQIHDHLEFARKELQRFDTVQGSLFWQVFSPLLKLCNFSLGKKSDLIFEKTITDQLRTQIASLSTERLQTVDQLREALEQSERLRQKASYILRQTRGSFLWEMTGPLRVVYAVLFDRKRSTLPMAATQSATAKSAKSERSPISEHDKPSVGERSDITSKDFLIWIFQDFLQPVTNSIITINGWCFCKKPEYAAIQLRCQIGHREYFADYGRREDHVGDHYKEYPQALHSGFDFYGMRIKSQDEDIRLQASVDGITWHDVLLLPVNNQIRSISEGSAIEIAQESKEIAIYYPKSGNYFYREIALYLARAVRELGWKSYVLDSEKQFNPQMRWHWIVSPNEFYFLGNFPDELADLRRKNIVFLLTDQPHTSWFKRSLSLTDIASHILDISHDTVPLLKEKGLKTQYLPLGYLPGFPLYEGAGNLPIVPETEALGRSIRTFDSKGLSLKERPIDVSFVGTLTPRRDRFFAQNAAHFCKYHCHFRFVGAVHVPISEDRDSNIETLVTAGISRRSRIVLNIHRDDEPYFEWHRMVLLGIWQEALVVTEKSTAAPPFVSGEDYVEADIKEVPDALDYYLRDPKGMEEAEQIRSAAFQKFRTECLFKETLRKNFEALL